MKITPYARRARARRLREIAYATWLAGRPWHHEPGRGPAGLDTTGEVWKRRLFRAHLRLEQRTRWAKKPAHVARTVRAQRLHVAYAARRR